MKTPTFLILFTILAFIPLPLQADRNLDGKKAEKLEIRHSMLGFRDTLLFYSFKDQGAILVVSIANKDETFPVSGKIYLFDKATTEEGLKKWVNNQHSDALFADAPEPIYTGELPKGSCKIASHKKTGTSQNPGPRPGKYDDFEVELSVAEHEVEGKYQLPAFTDTARVHVESK